MRVTAALLLAALPALALDEEISKDTRLPAGTHLLERPLRIMADGITVDLGDAVLRGSPEGTDPDRFEGIGIVVDGRKGVTIRGGRLAGFKCAILARGCEGLVLEGIDVSHNFAQRLRSTPEREFAGDWLWPHENDEQQWRKNYGAGICLEQCVRATVRECRGRNQQNGLLLDRCEECRVYDNDFSFNSGWGIALWRSCENVISRNRCDWCVRGYSHGVYDRGQDSAGILVFEQCSRNTFVRNSATHSGDGFFLYAGHETTRRTGTGGCNDNLLLVNDFSHAVANAIEATFSRGNRFQGNRCDDSNYGVWAGYSYWTLVKWNSFRANSIAGVAIEHGWRNTITQNQFAGNPRGIWLWWDNDEELLASAFGKAQPCRSEFYSILDNRFEGDRTAVHLQDTTWVNVNGGNTFVDVGKRVVTEGESGLTEGIFDHPAPDLVVDAPGEQEPFLPEGHPRGREYIMIGEWGPLDPTQPGVYPTEATGACTYRVLGAGEYEVTVPEGFTVEKDGRTFRVKGGPGLSSFAGEVRLGEQRFPIRGLLFNAKWTIRHWKWAIDPREDAEAWRALLATEPLLSVERDRLDEAWGHGGPGGVKDGFATRAETRVRLPAGRYRLSTLSDDGVRVLLDGEVVQEDWTWHGPTEHVTNVEVAEGEHEIVVEHFELDGYAVLRLELRPAP